MRKRVVFGVGLALVVAAQLVMADDESDRRDLMARIDAKLDSAARELYSLDRESDASNVDDAQGYVREVEELVNELKGVKGDDSAANRISDDYPDYIRDFRDASDALRTLKKRQGKAADYLRQCREFDAAMVAKANAAKDDPDGAAELLEFARTTGKKGEDVLSDASREWSEVERNRDDAKRFSTSEGHWSDVRSNLQSSADAIAQIWRDNWDKAKSACEEVVKREHHRDVERVLEKLANSREGRAELRRKIDEQLDSIAERIKDVQSQSDASYVSAALDNTRELESLLDKLGNAAGDDRAAREIAASWPAWVRQLRESLEALENLKLNQRRADGLGGACEQTERSLDATIKTVVADKDQYPDPERTIDDEADRLGKPISDGLQSASGVDRQMSDWTNKAKNFSQSDGKWSRVSSNLRDSADRVYAHWREQYGTMTKSCAVIALGHDDPNVKREIAQWQGTALSTADQLEKDVNAWVDLARATYRLDCNAMQDMWQAYCGADFDPANGDETAQAKEQAEQTAARLQDQMQAAMKPLLAQLPALDARVTLLGKKTATKSKANDLVAKLKKERDRLNRLSVQGVWRGSNDPLKFYAAEYGKQAHEKLWSDKHCDVPTAADKEARFPGSAPNKPDCIVADECQIWEFKPKSPSGERKGKDQIDSYKDLVPKYYNERYSSKQAPSADLGGEETMKKLVAKCLRDNKIKLDADVYFYDMCEKHYECVGD
jgi:hypothetical protein